MSTTLFSSLYSREGLKPRILHLGFGAFARAHPMVYLHHGLAQRGGDWGVIAARLNSGVEGLNALDAADGVYHVVEADGADITLNQIGVLLGTCHPARDGGMALINLLASPDLSVVLLTITEKGYCTRHGALDLSHPGIQADLTGQTPQTAIGLLVAGLQKRRAEGLGGLTLLSCDNQPDNGNLTRAAIVGFAKEQDETLARWIEEDVRFPSSMVDRIVPAMSVESHETVAAALGYEDPNAILCEPFRQWVIEDDFVGAPPPFEAGGALLVKDVQPFEEMKLRLLNGAHTMLAWLGQLLGHETVADCMSDQDLPVLLRRLMLSEQAPTLTVPQGVDVEGYAEELLQRFTNARLQHRLAQIATDSSQKMPQRLFAPIALHLTTQRAWPVSALAIAAWILGLRDLDPIADPHQFSLREAAQQDDPVKAIFGLTDIVPQDLVQNAVFRASITEAFRALKQNPRAAIKQLLSETPA